MIIVSVFSHDGEIGSVSSKNTVGSVRALFVDAHKQVFITLPKDLLCFSTLRIISESKDLYLLEVLSM